MFDTNVLFTPLCMYSIQIYYRINCRLHSWVRAELRLPRTTQVFLCPATARNVFPTHRRGQKVWTSNPNIIKYLIQHENSIKGWRTRTRENEPTKTSLNEYIYYHITRYRVSERSVSKC